MARWEWIETDMDNHYRPAECVFPYTSRDGILVFTELPGYRNHVVNYNIQQVTTWSKWPVYYRESEHTKKQFFLFLTISACLSIDLLLI